MADARKKIWVDRFQTRLLIRIGFYLALYLLCVANLLFIWQMLQGGGSNPLMQLGDAMDSTKPTLLCLLALLPMLIYDTLRFTHRLVGPLVRFRQAMQAIARGETIRPIKLRPGDFQDDLRDDFNQMLEALQKRGVAVLKPLDEAEETQERKIG